MYHKWQSYDVWLLRYGVQRTEFFVILDQFLPFYPANNSKNQNFEKMKKPPEGIILHMCSINDNHMMCGSWDMEHDGQNFLSRWTIFCPFILLTSRKIKIIKKRKEKTPGDIIILRKCTRNNNHMMYGSWDMERDRENFLSCWTIFCTFTTPLPSLQTQKIKILKKWKNHLEISSFYTCVP